MRWGALLVLVGVAFAAPGHAKDNLWCRVKAGQVAGVAKAPKITDFAWSGAHEVGEITGPLKTSIGRIDQGEGPNHSTVITVDGKAVSLRPAASGSIRFGKVYDFGGKVAVAFLVETATDSSASPSEAIVLLSKGPRVLEQHAMTSDQASSNACPLL